MNNREAIKCCKGMIQRLERPAFIVRHEGAINDIMALEIAISALEKQTADKCCETCKYEDLELEAYPCCDCIRAKDHYEPYTEEEA